MKYLIDTHIILWWLVDPNKIANKARDIITNRDNPIFVSSISFWEMAIKKDLGKLTIPMNTLEVLTSQHFEILPFRAEEALGVIDLPKIHMDPFDRALISQAKYNDMVFITRNKKIIDYPIVSIDA